MTYDEQIVVIEADLRGKLHRRDWHGVMDCAADIRELEAAKRGYENGAINTTNRPRTSPHDPECCCSVCCGLKSV